MKKASAFALTVFLLTTLSSLCQNDVSTFKTSVRSAFVWGEDSSQGAISSTIQDPLTGNAIPKISYAGIEVNSRMGFERVGMGEAGDFLSYTTTIVNDTDSPISVRYGGISVDGHSAPPLSVVSKSKPRNKKDTNRKTGVVEIGDLHCFSSGFLSSENFFLANAATEVFAVDPGTAWTVSSVIRDPRNYSVRCSTEGCHPTGTIRYFLRVNSQDYVFVWPGRSVAYCGK